MKLANPFTSATRELWRDWWECLQCGGNGQGVGGLELHHITGRDSNSPLNGAVVCKECHSHMGHSKDEERQLFAATMQYLLNQKYSLTKDDEQYMLDHPYLIHNNEHLENVLQ